MIILSPMQANLVWPINPAYVYIPEYIIPLSYNHAVDGNLSIDYRFGKDDGPSLHQFGASFLFTFSSGHPYTLGVTNGLNADATTNPNQPIVVDTRNRTAYEALNSSVTPSRLLSLISVLIRQSILWINYPQIFLFR